MTHYRCPACLAAQNDVPAVMEKVLQNNNHRGVTCCTNCATVLMFERGVLRMPTDSETEKIEAHPIHALVTLMQTVITSKVAEN